MTRVPTTPPEPSGRLELTWTNKHLRLLAHDDTTYEWCDPADYRVAEVRLLNEVTTVGDDPGDNLVIQGDALHALTALTTVPEYREQYLGKVKCCYIDPPFNTGQTFTQYDDALEHSVWLTMLRDRLVQIKLLLSGDGSVWVHLDHSEEHRARIVLDEVFGPENFVASIAWEKTRGAKGDTDISASHDVIHVYARSRAAFRQTRNLIPRTAGQLKRYANPDDDPRGPWRQGADGTAKSGSDKNRWPIELPSGRSVTPPKGSYWRFSKETFEKAQAEGRVYFGQQGDSMPVIKTYLAEAKDGVVPTTWWSSDEVGSNQEAKRDHLRKMFPDIEPFDTPKPERLLRRILQIATDPGDIVLDCFAGSGATAAVAHKMGRRWVTVERSASTVENFVVPRLRKVVDGTETGGISTEEVEHDDESDLPDGMAPADAKSSVSTVEALRDHGTFNDLDVDVVKVIQSVLRKAAKNPEGLPNGVAADTVQAMVKTFKALNDAQLFAELSDTVTKKVTSAMRAASKTRKETVVHWAGGGGFRVVEVAPSMYETVDDFLVLAEWMTAGELAKGVAAQVGYTFEPDGPFTGRKGRSRLAVIDGLLTRDVIDFLVGQLAEKERLLVVAHALEPGVEEYVRDKVAGSRVRKIPRDLVRTSSGPRRLVNLAEPTSAHEEVEEVAS